MGILTHRTTVSAPVAIASASTAPPRPPAPLGDPSPTPLSSGAAPTPSAGSGGGVTVCIPRGDEPCSFLTGSQVVMLFTLTGALLMFAFGCGMLAGRRLGEGNVPRAAGTVRRGRLVGRLPAGTNEYGELD